MENQNNFASHLNQRVAVFIDTQNLYHSAKSLFRSNVDYERLMQRAVNNRNLVRAFAYVIKSEENTEAKFFEAIEELGIETRVKDLQIFHTGAKKADWDVGIAVDMIRLTEKVDVVVLASGDGDFLEVVRYCQSRGVRVELMAFEKTANAKILEEVDYFIDLGDKEDDFIISARKKKLIKKVVEEVDVDFDKYAHSDYPAAKVYKAVTKPAVSLHQEIYGSKNLPTYLRKNSENKVVNEKIYGLNKTKRKIKPVVGLPAKPKLSSGSSSIENAFGNRRSQN